MDLLDDCVKRGKSVWTSWSAAAGGEGDCEIGSCRQVSSWNHEVCISLCLAGTSCQSAAASKNVSEREKRASWCDAERVGLFGGLEV